ncbi:MAG: hypothetical protein HY606_04250 [Planctomycetes bacterium]|nr:hypothetical protein [Planctomycetota bacterium]
MKLTALKIICLLLIGLLMGMQQNPVSLLQGVKSTQIAAPPWRGQVYSLPDTFVTAVKVIQTNGGLLAIANSYDQMRGVSEVLVIKLKNDLTIETARAVGSGGWGLSAASVAATSDGGCVILAQNNNNMVIITADSNGFITGAVEFNFSNLSFRSDPAQVIVTRDGGLVILAREPNGFFVARFALNPFRILFSTSYSAAAIDRIQSIAEVGYNFVVTGYSTNGIQQDWFICEIDGLGNNSRTFIAGSSMNDSAQYVISNSVSGDIIIVGTMGVISGSGQRDIDSVLFRSSPDFSSYQFLRSNQPQSDIGFYVEETGAGNMLDLGDVYNHSGAVTYSSFSLCKKDWAGYTQWCGIYDNINNFEQPVSATTTSDGNYAIIGNTYGNTSYPSKIVMLKVRSSDGMITFSNNEWVYAQPSNSSVPYGITLLNGPVLTPAGRNLVFYPATGTVRVITNFIQQTIAP